MNCPYCGSVVADGTVMCPRCGRALMSPPPPPAAAYGAPPQTGYPAAGYPPAGYPPAGYARPAPPRSRRALALVLVLVVIGVAVAVAAFVLSGGGAATGSCVGVSWNGSYYDYTRVYGYTEAECDAWCSSHSFGTSCYWEP